MNLFGQCLAFEGNSTEHGALTLTFPFDRNKKSKSWTLLLSPFSRVISDISCLIGTDPADGRGLAAVT